MNWRPWFTNSSWWGKWIGACLGYLIAGPTGALFGILIGNFFDRGLVQHFSRPHWFYYAEKRKAVQEIFFKSTFQVLGYIAKADGYVSENDIQMASQLMKEMGLKQSQKRQAQQYFSEGKSGTFNLAGALVTLNTAIYDNKELVKLFLDIQYRAAQVDGFSSQKLKALNLILNHMGFASVQEQYRFYEDFEMPGSHQSSAHHQSSSEYQRQSNKASSNALDHAYAILGVFPNSSKQDVKQAYRRLMSRNHPDKLIAEGLPEAMIKIANEKTQRISKAFEDICKSKGW